MTDEQKIDGSGGGRYTCAHYREEMLLLSLERRRNDPSLSSQERALLTAEIDRLRRRLDMQ